MPKRPPRAPGVRLRSLALAAFVVALPLAAPGDGGFGRGAWPVTSDAPQWALVLAVALALAVLLRAFAGATMRGLAVRRLAGTVPGDGRSMRQRGLPRPAERVGEEPQAALAPTANAQATRAHGAALERIRARVDEVSYRPGKPNVLSMTKYLRAGAAPPDTPAGAFGPTEVVHREDADASGFSRRDVGDATVLEIRGVLDAISAPTIRPVIDALVAERGTRITEEVSSLRLIDSSGVGVIVGLYKRCAAFGGAVQVSGLREQPLAVFALLRLGRNFTLP